MQDTTVSGMCFASDSGAKSRRRVFSRAVRHANEDELLGPGAHHQLEPGHRPCPARRAAAVADEDELISFWADDHIPAPRTGSG